MTCLLTIQKCYRSAYEIYRELVLKWIEREAVENELLFEFSEKVAEHMYLKKTVYITKNEIEELCKEYNIQIKSIEAKSRSLLNRNANGSYKFAHKSILEYFLAKKAYNDLQFRVSITKNGFIGYDMVKHFLHELDTEYVNGLYLKNVLKMESVSFKFLQLSGFRVIARSIKDCDFEGCNFSGGGHFFLLSSFHQNFGMLIFKKQTFWKLVLKILI